MVVSPTIAVFCYSCLAFWDRGREAAAQQLDEDAEDEEPKELCKLCQPHKKPCCLKCLLGCCLGTSSSLLLHSQTLGTIISTAFTFAAVGSCVTLLHLLLWEANKPLPAVLFLRVVLLPLLAFISH
eukprot:4402592-Amphidinium_carterae.1